MSVAGNQNFICLFASLTVTKSHFPSWTNFTSAAVLNDSELWLFESSPVVHYREGQALAEEEYLNL